MGERLFSGMISTRGGANSSDESRSLVRIVEGGNTPDKAYLLAELARAYPEGQHISPKPAECIKSPGLKSEAFVYTSEICYAAERHTSRRDIIRSKPTTS